MILNCSSRKLPCHGRRILRHRRKAPSMARSSASQGDPICAPADKLSFFEREGKAAAVAPAEGAGQGLLPPRKRLLAGLKHRLPWPPPASSTSSDEDEGGEESSGEGEGEKAREEDDDDEGRGRGGEHKEDAEATASMADCKQVRISLPPAASTLHKCSRCGACDREHEHLFLHRLPLHKNAYHCSACILTSHKHMYCFLCLETFEPHTVSFSSSSVFSCCNCHRVGHLHCAFERLESVALDGSLCTECAFCERATESPSSNLQQPSTGSLKISNLYKVTLAAAKVVAALAAREASEAKEKATEMATIAARASILAKRALDNAYRIGKQEALIAKSLKEDGEMQQKKNLHIKTPRSSTPVHGKRRTLSSIVASEESLFKPGLDSSSPLVSIAKTKSKLSVKRSSAKVAANAFSQHAASSSLAVEVLEARCSVLSLPNTGTSSISKTNNNAKRRKLNSPAKKFSPLLNVGRKETSPIRNKESLCGSDLSCSNMRSTVGVLNGPARSQSTTQSTSSSSQSLSSEHATKHGHNQVMEWNHLLQHCQQAGKLDASATDDRKGMLNSASTMRLNVCK